MPSFSEIVGVIVTLITLAVAAGQGSLVWRTLGELRQTAIEQSRRDWGCPSLTKGACTSYDPRRYR